MGTYAGVGARSDSRSYWRSRFQLARTWAPIRATFAGVDSQARAIMRGR